MTNRIECDRCGTIIVGNRHQAYEFMRDSLSGKVPADLCDGCNAGIEVLREKSIEEIKTWWLEKRKGVGRV